MIVAVMVIAAALTGVLFWAATPVADHHGNRRHERLDLIACRPRRPALRQLPRVCTDRVTVLPLLRGRPGQAAATGPQQ